MVYYIIFKTNYLYCNIIRLLLFIFITILHMIFLKVFKLQYFLANKWYVRTNFYNLFKILKTINIMHKLKL